MNSSNEGRILTLVVKIKDAESAKAIWEAHMYSEKLMAGCMVLSIAEGDQIAQLEELRLDEFDGLDEELDDFGEEF